MTMTSRRRWSAVAATVSMLVGSLVAAAPAATASPSVPPVPSVSPAYPAVGAGTQLIDHDAKLAGFNDADWYKANIPFLDVPDQQIEQVYYYRWRTWKEHLRYTNPQDGWISTEFLDCCGYAAPYQAINAATGHQVTEGQWVRDRSYGDDYVKFWLTGPGAGAKPADDGVNADTTDWAHEYSMWLASAAFERASVTGDTSAVIALLPQLEKQFHGWDKQYNATLGLYWSVPVWDAMEFSASSYASSDPYHGGAGYRPTLNSYQYGDALAISRIAALAGDNRTARQYAAKATSIKQAMQKYLWDPQRKFYYAVARDNNPTLTKLDTREEIGFIPWAFDAALPQDAAAWGQLFDPQGFAAPFGPTTAERRSPVFMKDAGNCCRWDGPSWPFATSQTLTAMANLLNDYPTQKVLSANDYAAQLHTYAATQYKNGKPYVAEAHSPDTDQWIYDGYNHSEDYNHSTYVDPVISGLMGIRPSIGDELTINPLTPANWTHFALENVPYHGHNITIEYDRDGTHYHVGTGYKIFVDGVRVAARAAVGSMTIRLRGAATSGPAPHVVNDAANPLRIGYPQPITSYTWRYDSPWNALDGKVWFNEVPENTRWTNYASPNQQDYYGVDFGVPTDVSDVRFYGYDDGGGVRPAAGYTVQYWTGQAWADVPHQVHTPQAPVGNGLNRITFPSVLTSKIRLLLDNPAGAFVGVTELQSFSESSTAAAVNINNGAAVSVLPGKTITVNTTVAATGKPLHQVNVQLRAPAGWTVTPNGKTTAASVNGHKAFTTSWSVTAPLDAIGQASVPLLVSATYRQAGRRLTTHTQIAAQIGFDPSMYPKVQLDDRFSTDTSANYQLLQPSQTEVLPALSVGGGQLSGSGSRAFFGLLDSGVSPASTDTALILTAKSYIGASAPNQDSLFLGLDGGAVDYVAGWYNNHFGTSGVDVRSAGALNPSGSGTCCTNVTIAPGDQFALQVHGTQLSTYLGHHGTWTRLATTDVAGVTTLAGYHAMFGLRGDPGTISVSRFQVLSR